MNLTLPQGISVVEIHPGVLTVVMDACTQGITATLGEFRCERKTPEGRREIDGDQVNMLCDTVHKHKKA